jgi:predicted TPR repeat methyltransferase
LFDEPDDVDCLSAMVTQNVRDKDMTSARVHAERLRILAPDSVSSLLADAQIADYSGDLSAAVRAYERACAHGQEFACVRAGELRKATAR